MNPELGQSPEGFDCSGLVRYVLLQAGLIIPDYIGLDNERRQIRHSNEIADHLGVQTHFGAHQPGDIAVFSKKGYIPDHVGIVIDEESYIHAPGKENTRVMVASLAERAIRQTGILPGPYLVNPIVIKSPVVPIAQPTSRYHQQPLEYS